MLVCIKTKTNKIFQYPRVLPLPFGNTADQSKLVPRLTSLASKVPMADPSV